MAGGYMSLAYMAELGVIANLAYLELESFRYIEDARKKIDDVLLKISDDKGHKDHNGDIVGNQQFMNCYNQAKGIIDGADYDHWYIKPPTASTKKRFWWAYWIYVFFTSKWDKKIATIFLMSAGSIIFLITMLNNYFSIDHLDGPHQVCWYILFACLTISVVIPCAFVISGRHLNASLVKIAGYIDEEKNKVALAEVASKIGSPASNEG